MGASFFGTFVAIPQQINFLRSEVKANDETIQNDTTLSDDSELFIPVRANETLVFKLILLQTAGTTPDLKVAFSGPTGSSGWWNDTSVTAAAAIPIDGSTSQVYSGVNSPSVAQIVFEGVLINGATAGNLTFMWAQNTLSAFNTTVKAKSTLMGWVL